MNSSETAPMAPVAVISMADAGERRAAFAARAGQAAVGWRFVDACTGLADGLRYDARAVECNKGRQLSPGEIGCYSSHFSLWRDMAGRGTRQLIVLEDDTIVDWAFLARLAATDLAAHDIPYLRLYWKLPTVSRTVRRHFLHHARSLVELAGYPFGTQAYAITLDGARAFLRACETITRPIDDQMDRSWDHGVRNLALFPAPVIEACGESAIGGTRHDGARSAAFYAPRARAARWIDRQRMRMKQLSLLHGR